MSVLKRDWLAILTDARSRGLRAKEIALEQGLSVSAVYGQAAKHEISLGPCGAPPKSEWRKTLLDALEAGKSQAQVARELKLSAAAVCKQAKRYGIVLPKNLYRPQRRAA
mgnify:CR=1 FL=1